MREVGITVFIISWYVLAEGGGGEFLLLPVEGYLLEPSGGHGVEGVWLWQGENILTIWLIHRLIPGPRKVGCILMFSSCLVLVFTWLVVWSWDRCRVVTHHKCHAIIFGTPSVGHFSHLPSGYIWHCSQYWPAAGVEQTWQTNWTIFSKYLKIFYNLSYLNFWLIFQPLTALVLLQLGTM